MRALWVATLAITIGIAILRIGLPHIVLRSVREWQMLDSVSGAQESQIQIPSLQTIR